MSDYIKMLAELFICKRCTKKSTIHFESYFNKSENLHHHKTRHAKQNSIILTHRNTDFYGMKPIQNQSALTYNKLQKAANHNLLQEFRSTTKEFITYKILNIY